MSEVEGQKMEFSTASVQALARIAGFDDARLLALPYEREVIDRERFMAWLETGAAGSMEYLRRTNEAGELLRGKLAAGFPWARSVVVLWTNYNRRAARSTDPAPDGSGWIARYAWSSRVDERGRRVPSDYHKILRKRVNRLEALLHERFGEFEARGFVDTGPVLERSLAAASGLGWIGKNACLIHPRLGSYGFLTVLLSSLEFQAIQTQPEPHPDRCGSCRQCIEICPTEALGVAPDGSRTMAAERCISYLTIEHKGEISQDLRATVGRQIFGCDLCQDACPWNRKAPAREDEELAARGELVNPSLAELWAMTEAEWELWANGSPLRRAGWEGWRRNLALAIENVRRGISKQDGH